MIENHSVSDGLPVQSDQYLTTTTTTTTELEVSDD